MIESAVESNFLVAHRLHRYERTCKEVYGHNFAVEVTISEKRLNKIGFGIDFLDLKNDIDYFLKRFDHKNLNEFKTFKKITPTSENMAIWPYDSLSEKINSKNIKIIKVKIKESPQFKANYYEEKKRQ